MKENNNNKNYNKHLSVAISRILSQKQKLKISKCKWEIPLPPHTHILHWLNIILKIQNLDIHRHRIKKKNKTVKTAEMWNCFYENLIIGLDYLEIRAN